MSENSHGPHDNSLPRSRILRSRTAIVRLFAEGRTLSFSPFRVMYYWNEPEEEPVKVLFSVSKRNFRRAVHRNRIRRLMREAWRRHWRPLLEMSAEKQKSLHIALVYTRREMPDFASIENKIIQLIHRLTSLDETVA